MDLDDQRDYAEEAANRRLLQEETEEECAHPWHRVSTPDHEPVETTCPQCGDRA